MLNDEDFIKLINNENDRVDTRELQFYDSFEQKRSVFGTYTRYESSTQFMYFINQELQALLGTQNAVYRGLTSARYRLFNKAQRSFVANKYYDSKNEQNNKIFHGGVEELIENARKVNNGVLPGFFKATGLKNSHISILSFLQHYGAPTPFMDWTTDPFVALFFAIMGMTDEEINRYHNAPVTYEIEDYFSLSILIKDQTIGQINEFRELKVSNKGSIDYTRLRKKKFQFINEMYKSGRPSFSLVNNLHIVNQKGLFIIIILLLFL